MYNKQFKFIFVEIDKNATTLLTECLKHVSHFWQPQEALRKKYGIVNDKGELDQDSLKKLCKESWHYKHASLSFWKCQLGEEEFNLCTKFALVRNSWDRVVSLYLRDQGSNFRDRMSFGEFVRWIKNASDTCGSFGENGLTVEDAERYDLKCSGFGPDPDGEDRGGHHRGKRRHQLSYLTVDGSVGIDYWLSVSEGGWHNKIFTALNGSGIEGPVIQAMRDYFSKVLGEKRCLMNKDASECPGASYASGGAHECMQLNRSPNRNQKLHYSIYYTDETRDIIGEKFQKDNEFFGFNFEDRRGDFSAIGKINQLELDKVRKENNILV